MSEPTSDKRLAVRERPSGRKAIMLQKWRDLLFLHWPFEPEFIQSIIPPELKVDTFDGAAYLGVVPFFMKDIRPFMLPPMIFYSNFPELNFRTYVYDESGTPGVWFFSLDASNWLAVEAARRWYNLPYFHAEMNAERDPETGIIDYSSRRVGTTESQVCSFSYQPVSAFETPEPGSFEFFLLERYVLFAYSERQKAMYSGRVYHTPYPVCDVEVFDYNDSLFEINGLARPGVPPVHAIMSPGVDVEIFSLEKISSS